MNLLKSAAEFFTPVLKTSQFHDKGVLTPEEFVAAGDELTYKCPTWQWSAGDPACRKPYLPVDKQMLITRGVPCLRRVNELDGDYTEDAAVAADGGWVATKDPNHRNGDGDDDEGEEDIIAGPSTATATTASAGTAAAAALTVCGIVVDEGAHIGDEEATGTAVEDATEKVVASTATVPVSAAAAAPAPPAATTAAPAAPATTAAAAEEDDDEYLDMSTFEEDNLVADEATATAVAGGAGLGAGAGGATAATYMTAVEPEDTIFRTRTYDLSICYDKYYQTPHMYLFGYNEHQEPLTEEQLFQDVMQDYAHKTVTMEAHPHLPASGVFASIHPCRHAETMKRIVDHMTASESDDANTSTAPVAQYLFIFLKFIQSVVPTINYDYTLAVHATTTE